MEIGEERIDSAEAITRLDEDRSLAGEGMQSAVFISSGFEQAQSRRADRDDATAPRPRRIQRIGRLR